MLMKKIQVLMVGKVSATWCSNNRQKTYHNQKRRKIPLNLTVFCTSRESEKKLSIILMIFCEKSGKFVYISPFKFPKLVGTHVI